MKFFLKVGMILPLWEPKTRKNTNFTHIMGEMVGGGGFALNEATAFLVLYRKFPITHEIFKFSMYSQALSVPEKLTIESKLKGSYSLQRFWPNYYFRDMIGFA